MRQLVSICIPTYNGDKYLQEALDSVKAQTYRNIEVVISDDASKDSTLAICHNFKNEVDFPVYIYSHQPCGIGANWNHCIEKANGDYIKFLFQDDVLEPDCLAMQLSYIETYDLQVVCSKRKIINAEGETITRGKWFESCYDLQKIYLNLDFKNFYLFSKKDLKRLKPPHLLANLFGEPIAFLYNKKIFEYTGLFNNHYQQILDLEHSYRILKKYPIGIIDTPLFSFRLHDEQQSSLNNSQLEILPEYKTFEFYLMKNFRFSNKMTWYFLTKYFLLFNLPFRVYLKILSTFK